MKHHLRLPPACAGMSIGLLGGSFNPAHAGHRHVSEIALKRLGLDRVWWLVTPGNPLKNPGDLAPLDERIETAAAVARHPKIAVTAFEAGRGLTYSIDTIRHLQARLPAVRFIWLIGADNLMQFHRWRSWREIAARVPILVVDRPGARLATLKAPAAQLLARYRVGEAGLRCLTRTAPPAWGFAFGPLSPLSSTEIRAKQR